MRSVQHIKITGRIQTHTCYYRPKYVHMCCYLHLYPLKWSPSYPCNRDPGTTCWDVWCIGLRNNWLYILDVISYCRKLRVTNLRKLGTDANSNVLLMNVTHRVYLLKMMNPSLDTLPSSAIAITDVLLRRRRENEIIKYSRLKNMQLFAIVLLCIEREK